MSLLRDAFLQYRRHGVSSLLQQAGNFIGTSLIDRIESSRSDIQVVDEDWDNLIILDACRYDRFKKINNLPGTLERRNSCGSVTWEFLRENFEGRQLHDTIYVAGNAVVGDTADALDVYKLVGLWNSGDGPDGHPEVVFPEAVVEEAITQYESHPNKRLIVHFLQPHEPFLRKDGKPLASDSKYYNFECARAGDVSATEIQAVYDENLKYVLQHVADLIDRVDGKTIVTADHGELLGEGIPTVYQLLHPRWPLRKRQNFDYGHYSHIRVPELVNIPWLVIDSDNRRKITSDIPPTTENVPETTTEQLKALGYRR